MPDVVPSIPTIYKKIYKEGTIGIPVIHAQTQQNMDFQYVNTPKNLNTIKPTKIYEERNNNVPVTGNNDYKL